MTHNLTYTLKVSQSVELLILGLIRLNLENHYQTTNMHLISKMDGL